ncbi:MAG: bifunctional folylpolyglutamate synthase/dihydrofolate synthase, partial [Hyphomicrobiaceae bacterium]
LKAFLEASGARVHCYTSPYLMRLHESIQIAGPGGAAAISEPRLCGALARVRDAAASAPVTPFEAETAAAFLMFSETPADFVLLETGLGGRLDATNVVSDPVLTVITPVSIDHAEYLGAAITDIAREKAGIMRRGVPVLVARQDDDAHGVIERYADELLAPMRSAGRDWDAYEQHGRLVFQDETHLRDLGLPVLAGRHQLDNAGLAIAAALTLDPGEKRVTDAMLEKGLATATWPARLHRLPHGALCDDLPEGSEVWLDGGHNAAAGTAIAHAMSDLEDNAPLPLFLVTGMLASKDPDAFLRPFRGLARTVLALTLKTDSHATAGPLKAEIIVGASEASGIEARAVVSVSEALSFAASQSDGPVRVLICGSLHLAGQVLGDLERTVSS